jgi:hypothetical protein
MARGFRLAESKDLSGRLKDEFKGWSRIRKFELIKTDEG